MSKIKLKDFLKEHDIRFLLSKTKLSPEKLSSLIEENYDFDLVFSTLSTKKHSKTQLKKLSPWLYWRYLVFKYSEKLDAPFEEKQFIADILPLYTSQIFDDTSKKQHKLDLENMNEDKACYLFVFLAFFEKDVLHGIPDFPLNKFILEIESTFRYNDKRDFAGRLNEWFGVIKEITEKDNIMFAAYREKGTKKCNLQLEPAKATDS
jgi:hypothetical protein